MPYCLRIFISISILTLSFFCQADNIPTLTLANKYQGQTDINQYWVSEKLDGVRAYWNGKQLISRQGNPFPAPSWFTKDFPTVALDGELWLGRGKFQTLVSIVKKKHAISSEWEQIRYFVFDLPKLKLPFNQRLNQLKKITHLHDGVYLQLVDQYQLADKKALMQSLEAVIKQGGEGLMLHHTDALYHSGRNNDLLKVKPYFDAEATVIKHLPGKGKFKGLMGALLVETPEGIRFKIGSGFSDKERLNPPTINSIITYTYHGKTQKGIPRFASFLRVRKNF